MLYLNIKIKNLATRLSAAGVTNVVAIYRYFAARRDGSTTDAAENL